jgi:hypothetical protein
MGHTMSSHGTVQRNHMYMHVIAVSHLIYIFNFTNFYTTSKLLPVVSIFFAIQKNEEVGESSVALRWLTGHYRRTVKA